VNLQCGSATDSIVKHTSSKILLEILEKEKVINGTISRATNS